MSGFRAALMIAVGAPTLVYALISAYGLIYHKPLPRFRPYILVIMIVLLTAILVDFFVHPA
jgi:FtsH-binding integral membrane protein